MGAKASLGNTAPSTPCSGLPISAICPPGVPGQSTALQGHVLLLPGLHPRGVLAVLPTPLWAPGSVPVPCCSYLSWLHRVSNAAAPKGSLLAVSSSLGQTPLHHLLCAPCASIPTRYWHWHRVTEKNDGLSVALSLFLIIPRYRILCCNTKDHLKQ